MLQKDKKALLDHVYYKHIILNPVSLIRIANDTNCNHRAIRGSCRAYVTPITRNLGCAEEAYFWSIKVTNKKAMR